ncbi:hypothetical protein [Conexibacter sp. SYSU D00693]|uniref:hypothetical protein n=1 Tax=Conexibacter sp. SYSU D00693 TaxID=2812560 RepID=UPI00196A3F7E|nr:hypothetical protein [Conexibacter sp. SYSU D00693]
MLALTVHARRRAVPAWALAGGCALLWLALAPRTPDLAAQVYRTTLFAKEGFAVWDTGWYGGHHLPGYSLLFPPLAHLVGPRPLGVLAAVASAVLFERLARRHWGPRATLGVAWFAAATCADLLIGRLTYALGVAVGLGALVALQAGRSRLATLLAAGASAASPVAGLFVALAGGTLVVACRDRRGAALAAAALGTILALAVAFPEGGRQPFSTVALLPTVGFSVALALLLPPQERVLRTGAWLYALAALAAFVLHTPVGSNVTRLGATFAGPLLACTALGVAAASPRRRAALLLVAVGMAGWQWKAPVVETAKGASDPSVHARYYTGLRAFLAERERQLGGPLRVEVPFTRGHWEAVHLAPRFSLARGWETQLDTERNALFYAKGRRLSAGAYERWLRRNAVAVVALPDAPLDPSARAEAQLVRRGTPYLREVWRDAHWRVFAVRGATPLVAGPGRLLALEPDAMALRASRPGTLRVRVRWTPYWTVVRGRACLERTRGDWTAVHARAAGRVVLEARLTAEGLVRRRGSACSSR